MATTLSRAGIHLRQLNAFRFLTCDCCTEGNESLLENKSFLSRDGGTNVSLLESLTHCSLLTTEKSHSSISFPNLQETTAFYTPQTISVIPVNPAKILSLHPQLQGHAYKKHLRSNHPATTICNGMCQLLDVGMGWKTGAFILVLLRIKLPGWELEVWFNHI